MVVGPGSSALVLCWDVLVLATVAVDGPAHAWKSKVGPASVRSWAWQGLVGLRSEGAASVSGPGISGAAIVTGTVTASPGESSNKIACRGAP